LRTSAFGACSSKKDLTRFSDKIAKDVMSPMPTSIAQPTLRNTKIREAYSEEHNKTPHCSGCSKCGDWERDTPLMTI
jgi:hypothetical protein